MKKEKIKEKAVAESQDKKAGKKGKKIAITIINVLINVLIVAVLIISVVIATLALTSKADPNGLPNIFGFTFEYVQTNSMYADPPEGCEGGNFSDQDVIICKVYSANEFPELDVGDIVTYRSSMLDSDGNTVLITHRIVEKRELSDGTIGYKTKGDANTVIDQQKDGQYLVPSNIVSVYYSDNYHGKTLKNFAEFFRTIRSQKGFFFFILIPMIAFFLYAIIRVIITTMNYKKEKADEDKKEAVDAAVAAALAEKESEDAAKSDLSPEKMTPEQLEQFKKFLAEQEAKKSEEDKEEKPEEEKPEETPEE